MKALFILIAIANLVDGFLTFIGLHFDIIREANPFMNLLITVEPFLFLALKIFLSFLLLVFLFLKVIPKSKIVRNLAIIATIGYSFVLFLHGNWILLYLF